MRIFTFQCNPSLFRCHLNIKNTPFIHFAIPTQYTAINSKYPIYFSRSNFLPNSFFPCRVLKIISFIETLFYNSIPAIKVRSPNNAEMKHITPYLSLSY